MSPLMQMAVQGEPGVESAVQRFVHELANVAQVHGMNQAQMADACAALGQRLIGMMVRGYTKDQLHALATELVERAGHRALVA